MNSWRVCMVAGWLSLGLAGGALAGPMPTAKPTSPPAAEQLSPEQKGQKVLELKQKLDGLFKAGNKWEQVVEVCTEWIKLDPKDPEGYYNLACGYARLGKKQMAMETLETSVKKGFNQGSHMAEDEDLVSLHDEAKFKDFVAQAKENDAKQEEGTYEKGDEIAGVKTVEDKPGGGLRYRLRMSPEATADKPNKLIIWLHPSGGSMNNVVERMAPELNKRGYALLVFTQKNFNNWTSEQMSRIGLDIIEVGKIKGIDPAKPILFGYSAGGQAALMIWEQNGANFGGLVLDAAYPIRMLEGGKAQLMALPPKVKGVPIFALVGSEDGGSKVWEMAEQAWNPEGVPLTVHYIAGKKHGWLFDQEQTDAFYKWLGNLPAASASQPAK